MSQLELLKQACQYILNSMIQNPSFDQKDKMQLNQSQLKISPEYIMINLDKQSESYGFFVCNSLDQRDWIAMMLDHLNEVHLKFGIHERTSTSVQQLMQLLIEEEANPSESGDPPQSIMTISDIKLARIVLYSKTPKFSLLLITFQPINRDVHMFIVRNFHGQIIEMALHSSDESKYRILIDFLLLFQTPFVIMFDYIDMNSIHSQIHLKQQLTTLSERVPLAYFTNKSSHHSFPSAAEKPFLYDLQINTLFSHEYNNKRQGFLSISQTEKNKIQQSLINYHQTLVREEAKTIDANIAQPKRLLKAIVKINYSRRIQNANQEKVQIKFEDFIKSDFQLFIATLMKSNQLSQKDKHDRTPIDVPAKCMHCLLARNTSCQASFMCSACSKIKQQDGFFCGKCFQSYHYTRGLLSNGSNRRHSDYGDNISQGSRSHAPNSHQKDAKPDQQHQKKEKNHHKRQQKFVEQKIPQLSEEQKQNLLKLQSSALNLVEAMSNMRNPGLFYKPKFPEATSQKQYEAQIKNQVEFNKVIDKIVVNEVKMFQNSVFLEISSIRRSTNQFKSIKNVEKINSQHKYHDHNNRKQNMDIKEVNQMEEMSSQRQ